MFVVASQNEATLGVTRAICEAVRGHRFTVGASRGHLSTLEVSDLMQRSWEVTIRTKVEWSGDEAAVEVTRATCEAPGGHRLKAGASRGHLSILEVTDRTGRAWSIAQVTESSGDESR